MAENLLKQSCRFFSADVPCFYHKNYGSVCQSCNYYQDVKFKILIIKLGALGDVLRTTSICEPLKTKYPDSKIFWITESQHIQVLVGNNFVDRIIEKNDALPYVLHLNFDIVINLDLDEDALILAGIARTRKKMGFWYNHDGFIECSNKYAQEYFLLSHDDKLKKKNKKTYQHFISKIADLPSFGRIIVPVSETARVKAEQFKQKHRLGNKKIIGAVVGTGKRWMTKRWPEDHFVKLFKILPDFDFVVFAGPEEKEIIDRIVKNSTTSVISAGHSNPVDIFFGLLNICDVVVCCDTFALHAAIGLGKKVVALFGPTSSNEIEMYGTGEKIVSPVDCVCCYRKNCSINPNCMEMISPEKVAETIRRLCIEK